MTVDVVLATIGALAPLVPYPPLATLVPVLVQLARATSKPGSALDTSQPVDLSTIGDAHRAAMEELMAELEKHKGGSIT